LFSLRLASFFAMRQRHAIAALLPADAITSLADATPIIFGFIFRGHDDDITPVFRRTY
jgi:hypothetical protein